MRRFQPWHLKRSNFENNSIAPTFNYRQRTGPSLYMHVRALPFTLSRAFIPFEKMDDGFFLFLAHHNVMHKCTVSFNDAPSYIK